MKRQWNGSERNSWAWCESRLFEKLTCWYFFISFWERMALNSSRFWLDIRRSFSVLYRWKTPTAFTHANSTAFATSWEKKQSEERGWLYFSRPLICAVIWKLETQITRYVSLTENCKLHSCLQTHLIWFDPWIMSLNECRGNFWTFNDFFELFFVQGGQGWTYIA